MDLSRYAAENLTEAKITKRINRTTKNGKSVINAIRNGSFEEYDSATNNNNRNSEANRRKYYSGNHISVVMKDQLDLKGVKR